MGVDFVGVDLVGMNRKITTASRQVSEHLIKNENKHQIMTVPTKWNCLIPILSSLVMYYLFQP